MRLLSLILLLFISIIISLFWFVFSSHVITPIDIQTFSNSYNISLEQNVLLKIAPVNILCKANDNGDYQNFKMQFDKTSESTTLILQNKKLFKQTVVNYSSRNELLEKITYINMLHSNDMFWSVKTISKCKRTILALQVVNPQRVNVINNTAVITLENNCSMQIKTLTPDVKLSYAQKWDMIFWDFNTEQINLNVQINVLCK